MSDRRNLYNVCHIKLGAQPTDSNRDSDRKCVRLRAKNEEEAWLKVAADHPDRKVTCATLMKRHATLDEDQLMKAFHRYLDACRGDWEAMVHAFNKFTDSNLKYEFREDEEASFEGMIDEVAFGYSQKP